MKKNLYFLFFLIFPLSAPAQEIHSFRLKNGLNLIVKTDHRFPTVVSQIWYKVGSSYEHNGITGISHALEHMMFRGTKKYGPGKLDELVAKNGGNQNAFTGFDFTAYYQVLPADRLSLSFELESDRMQNLTLDKNLFTKEMKAIQEERRLRIDDVPEGRLDEQFLAAAYVSSPYHHPVIGWKSDLDSMTIEDLRSWYQQWYTPNNATLVVVGNVNPQKTFELAQFYFGDIPSKSSPPLKPRTEIQPLGEKNLWVHTPAKVPSLMMGYLVPSLVTAKEAKTAYALWVASKILSGGSSARFEKDLIRKQQIATAAQTNYDLFRRQDGLFMIFAIPSQNHNTQVLKEHILKQIQDLQKNLVDSKELERVKSMAISEEIFKKDSLDEQANEIGIWESVGLSFKNAEEYIKQIESVTAEDIRKVAQTYLIPEKMTVAILDPLPMTPEKKAPHLPSQIPHENYPLRH